MKNKVNDGTVQIKLDGVEYDLKPTIEGVILMSRAYAGLSNLAQAVKNLDIEAMAVTVRAGALVDGKEAEQILPRLFKTGPINLMSDLLEFVLICTNGGVLPSDDDSEDLPGKP